MLSQLPVVKKRSDYLPPDFLIEEVKLEFELAGSDTRVICHTKLKRNGQHQRDLILSGENLKLVSVHLDGELETNYQLTDSELSLNIKLDNFGLRIETKLDPAENHSLEGLYLSSGAYCTQCEAEGFRKITYFLDRPDVLAKYEVCITADKKKYPYLLSNGNKVASGELSDGRHWVRWQDPFNKPSYLFALVAGDFDLLEDSFITASGRKVALQLYVDKGKLNRGQHALDSLKRAMAWDEKVFGLEYDLDIYMIVAVDFFNMGAMENKGLNVFNSKFVLADADSATDDDYFNIESVIAHEYFHNWTGNRVTCRDWFQLSLKEGLTVFRDQQFSSDMSSALVNRIKNVKVMREHQFAEDASAMSHPIRPDEVIEMNNFYTVTVYDKGAEVIRMIHTLLGQDGFRKGMDLYFQRFDGQAVTCDDFVDAMQDANDYDLAQFKRWYGQSGTPIVKVSEDFSAETGQYALRFEQVNKPTADQKHKQELHIPVNIELLNGQSNSSQSEQLFHLREAKQGIAFSDFKDKPIPVLLGGFSAPVMLEFDYSDSELGHIMLNAKDEFARWDASQKLFSKIIHAAAVDNNKTTLSQRQLIELCKVLMQQSAENPDLISEMLTLPSFETLCQQVSHFDVDALYQARLNLRTNIANELHQQWHALYLAQPRESYQYSQSQVNHRRLRNLALVYLSHSESGQALILEQYNEADNMTDTLGALKAAQSGNLSQFDNLMQDFEQKWRDDPLVLDKWFTLHASANRIDILPRLELLMGHKQFSINNPNRVRSLMGTFSFYNPLAFHALDGSGYKFVTDYLLKLNDINPQVAARIVTPLTQWQKLDGKRQELVKHQLMRIADHKSLSKDLYEKVSKSLNFIS
jgi:aminopeptidase N